MSSSPHVGTLGEKPLHASLKRWCSEPGDRFEVPVDGFVIDIVRDALLIEIQTKSFSSMKRKLHALLDAGHRVRLVHPIGLEKMIVKVDGEGLEISRRRSPVRGRPTDLFRELVSFPTLIDHPGCEIEVVLVREEEIRYHDPDRAWRRKGWVIAERRLVEVVDSARYSDAASLLTLLPEDLGEVFTTAELARTAGCNRRVAQQMAYCLREAGQIVKAGKQGNAVEYRVAATV
jgi:hypothetical protein